MKLLLNLATTFWRSCGFRYSDWQGRTVIPGDKLIDRVKASWGKS